MLLLLSLKRLLLMNKIVMKHRLLRLDALRTLESFVTHSNFDTLGGTIYYIPKVSADVLLVKGTLYDLVDNCIVAYMKYATEAGFVVRRSCQKRLRSRVMKQKYLVCNRKGCKACVVSNLGPGSPKFMLNVFDIIHNHELEREEFKHLSKTERQLTYAEEFCDVVSFDAFYQTNKYKMVFVPFTSIDNHTMCVTVAAGLLKNETTNSYVWLLKSCIKAFGKAPSIVVIDQDGAMRSVIQAEFAGSKHRLCMWHITQKLHA
ncbi:protein FAR1-related sequence 5 [Tanacetum coccineum]|uniref:Protein FAR1-related sequence 5 n=1 Tax=Tanacetum coccineum TaxID=301880 RepID=A0ABQ5A3W3_9ASTR